MRASDLTRYVLNPPESEQTFVWAVVTDTSPLRVALYGEVASIAPTAVAIPGPLTVGQRVYCCWQDTDLTVIGTDTAPGASGLIAYGERSGRRDFYDEAGYLEVRAILQPGFHYEVRAEYITWLTSPGSSVGRIRLRHGPAPVSLSAASKRTYVTTENASTGAQEAQSFVADVEVSSPTLYGGMVTGDKYKANQLRLYNSRIGIYIVGPSLTATGINL